MHGILLAHDSLSSVDYPTVTHAPPVAGNPPIKTLVARQQIIMYVVFALYCRKAGLLSFLLLS